MSQNAAQLSVGTGTPVLLWRTSTGVPPDPKTALVGGTAQIFRAGSFNDPVPIIIANQDATNRVTLGPVGVTDGVGTIIPAGGSITRNVVGNDSEYAIAHGGTVLVSVEVSRQ